MYNYAAYGQPAPTPSNHMMGSPYMAGSTMNQNQLGQPISDGYARGGKVKKAHLTLAHMSPHELNILDHLQGGTERHNKSGIRSYSHLEELLRNPHIRSSVHHHAHEHRAEGGTISHEELEQFKHDGRHGDTEAALIGPHTHHLFNMMAGHSTRNPHDGHPEYFSLKGALSGLWNSIKGAGSKVGSLFKKSAPAFSSIGQAALPALTDVASNALGNKFGDVGKTIANMGSGLAQKGLDRLGGGQTSNIGNAIGSGLGQAIASKHAGQSFGQALGSGLSHTGSQFGSNALGKGLGALGQGMQTGQGAKDILKNVGSQALEGMGGLKGLSQMGMNALAHKQAGHSFGESLKHGLIGGPGGAQNFIPSSEGMEREALMQELPFAGEAELPY